MKLLSGLALGALAVQGCGAMALAGRPRSLIRADPERRALLQDIVTFDESSLFINGERLMIYSGEFHPFRLPVPSLWADVFQKVKAMGLNTVSFYVHWGLVEGKPGNFTAEGVFALEPFFQAAKDAGIYLIARPGPYINAEATGGGFPGWIQRVKGKLRTSAPDYLAATDNYMANVGSIIAKGQITNGGPIILVQPENEYTNSDGVVSPFPDPAYMQYVEDQLRKAGVVVPLISNDAWAAGHDVPGSGEGEVDIYGHDGYPLGFDCANPYTWPAGDLPTTYRASHEAESPTTPYSIAEFQGGSFDPPGGLGFDQCAVLLNHEFARVFYKNNFAAGVTIFNLYMIFGGTNWGNIGHPGGYTSYDYGAAITEDRTLVREKYSEIKLEAQFLKVSPGYLTAVPGNLSTSLYASNAAIAVTPLIGTNGSFFVVRHADYASLDSTSYTLNLPTSAGTLRIPQLGGSLSLNGRDSKVHVTDYPVGDVTVLYSTAEVFTWKDFGDRKVLVVYGGPGELHELALKTSAPGRLVEGSGVTVKATNGTLVAQWKTAADRRILAVGNLFVYILDRNSAYDYWVPDLSATSAVIVKGPYLVRSASVDGPTLSIKADFNTTAAIEVIGAPKGVTGLRVNGLPLPYEKTAGGAWAAWAGYVAPPIPLPDLASLDWARVDSLPEIQPGYDDSAWPAADHATTNNTVAPLLGPVSLYGSDYGFHTGALLLRGHFTSAAGDEDTLRLWVQGGQAFGFSAWLDGTFLGSWAGIDADADHNATLALPNLEAGRAYVITVLVDNTGLDENWEVGPDEMKDPRGILDYALTGSGGDAATTTPVAWKITGNLGGEDYADRVRGPLNEGGLFAERQGYHQPGAPVSSPPFRSGPSPYEGIPAPGVAFYAARFRLALPSATHDVPLSFVFANDTAAAGGAYRAFLYVNGYQFGRYTSNVGPQTEFPVPEGVLDYGGDNWVGLALWALEAGGARVPGLKLAAGRPVLTARERVEVIDRPAWTKREGAY